MLNRISKASYGINGGFGARLVRTSKVGQRLNCVAIIIIIIIFSIISRRLPELEGDVPWVFV